MISSRGPAGNQDRSVRQSSTASQLRPAQSGKRSVDPSAAAASVSETPSRSRVPNREPVRDRSDDQIARVCQRRRRAAPASSFHVHGDEAVVVVGAIEDLIAVADHQPAGAAIALSWRWHGVLAVIPGPLSRQNSFSILEGRTVFLVGKGSASFDEPPRSCRLPRQRGEGDGGFRATLCGFGWGSGSAACSRCGRLAFCGCDLGFCQRGGVRAGNERCILGRSRGRRQ